MSNSNKSSDNKRPTSPIPIARNFRGRSGSVSSSSTDSPPSELPTPNSAGRTSPRIALPSPGSSPILSYFLAQSPSKTNATFPFRKFGTAPVFEEDESGVNEPHAAHHARRASTTVADRFTQPTNPVPDGHFERGSGLMRRLSLSTTGPPSFGKRSPDAPPNSAVSPTGQGFPPQRRATLSADPKPRRAPSPMGERILKGHFDGFN
ncbi:hypothetical protein D9758_012249 [Tetrapyrgos nigripes]|jgi:hypothetical protein|uniref:Uncharacterized protein n=1 Tax=Tetrapyrgos nigripes TaxID=182062 RepID=A0A8H5CIT0_9AGAR|nr:hypothetical protein D9758_012249 [Tetrapyrgos nigripes]